MALLKDGLKTTLGGLAIGIGVAVVAPVIVPILASIAKPLTKAIIKEGLILFDKGKEAAAEVKETIDDLLAEAKSEVEAGSADFAEETGAGTLVAAAPIAKTAAAKRDHRKQPARKKA
jgi:hypothetical protein